MVDIFWFIFCVFSVCFEVILIVLRLWWRQSCCCCIIASIATFGGFTSCCRWHRLLLLSYSRTRWFCYIISYEIVLAYAVVSRLRIAVVCAMMRCHAYSCLSNILMWFSSIFFIRRLYSYPQCRFTYWHLLCPFDILRPIYLFAFDLGVSSFSYYLLHPFQTRFHIEMYSSLSSG